MRTLNTQLRLKKLLRMERELAAHLAGPGADPRLGPVASRRLLAALRDVRAAWAADQSTASADLGLLRRHVDRALSRLELAAAALAPASAQPSALSAEFREVAVPLLFFLRGLEDTGEEGLKAWLAADSLAESA